VARRPGGASGSARPRAAVQDQRTRLLEGMVHVASRRGYGAASVTRVIERAGVSRATFYEHFANREECFLAAYREIASATRRRVRKAARKSAVVERPGAVLRSLLDGVAEDPATARLVLLEALGAGTRVRAEHERLIADTEAAISRYLAAGELHLPAAALLGGVAGILSMRILVGEGPAVSALFPDLLAWVRSYSLPDAVLYSDRDWRALGRGTLGPAQRLRVEETALLPRGHAAIEPAQAAEQRRRRILAATARLCRERGYRATSVQDIVAAARVTRGVFYAQYRGKEDAFLAVQTLTMQESLAAAAAEFFLPADWPERVWRAGEAMLSYIAHNPDLAHLQIIEAYAAGEAAIRRVDDNRMACVLFLEEGYGNLGAAAPPRLFSEAIAGAIFGLMQRQVAAGRTREMLEILPAAVYVAVAPFIGAEPALRFVQAQAAELERAPRARPRDPPSPRVRD
jgi:AcrR family transcriptional regulator